MNMSGGEIVTKILHVIGGGEYGGAEQYLINLAKEMHNSTYEIHLACFYDREFAHKLRDNSIPIHVILPKGRFDFSLATNIADLINREQYDIVHTHGVRANLFGRLAVSRINKVRKQQRKSLLPIFTTVHSELRQDYQNAIAYRLAYLLERTTQHLTDSFIAISNSIKDDMIRRGIPEKKIKVIYSGINFQADTSKDYQSVHDEQIIDVNNLRQQFADVPIIGMVGRLQAVKGHRYAILAMPQIVRQHPQAQLVIVGDGPLLEQLQALVNQLQLSNNVHFLGFQHPVTHIIRQFDMFLMPSLSEGLGLSLIEAMAEGIPAIATKVGGMVDVITGDIRSTNQYQSELATGILIPPEDPEAIAKAVIQLLNDPQQAIAMGERGQEDVRERFNSKRMIDEMDDLYKSIIQEHYTGAY
jgi:glycosyltransferase involved in cell wall biosynthesis